MKNLDKEHLLTVEKWIKKLQSKLTKQDFLNKFEPFLKEENDKLVLSVNTNNDCFGVVSVSQLEKNTIKKIKAIRLYKSQLMIDRNNVLYRFIVEEVDQIVNFHWEAI